MNISKKKCFLQTVFDVLPKKKKQLSFGRENQEEQKILDG